MSNREPSSSISRRQMLGTVGKAALGAAVLYPVLQTAILSDAYAAERPPRVLDAELLAVGLDAHRRALPRLPLAATLRDHWKDALLYRDLARLRTLEDGVPIPQHDVEELRWHGAVRTTWEAFCDEWELPRLRDRPHAWREA